ncbi:DUF4012 domain-containing protein [Cellulomonas sp. NPDC057328]|uniref:DUF4012 domain-containing protein n=1 Tax=Cellulomonas sp. NPDC057328 TaxID=3346101 RepID=UPI00362CE507
MTAGVAVLVLGAGAWFAMDALKARDSLEAAAADVARLQEHVAAGDVAAAEVVVPDLQRNAQDARERTDGPLWSLAGALPWAGPNVEAVQTVAQVVDGLAQRALPPLVQATTVVDPTALAPVDGRLDLDPIAAVAPQVVGADTAVRASVEQLDAVDTDGLVAMVAAPVEELRGRLAGVAADISTASKAVQLLPAMLGAEGPRQYLVLVQNNAEPRATGGIAGAVLLLRAEDGRLEVVEQRTGGELSGLEQPVVELTPAEQDLFGPLLATDMRDVNFTPDFPRSAQIARAIWAQQVGGEVDGVLSVDPGTLALVLGATGPVPLPDGGALTADDVVPTLLNQVYLNIESPQEQDAFFASTAAAVFAAVAGGQGDPAGAVDALAEAARQGRLMVWSAEADEQAVVQGTVLSGELRGTAGTSPVVGAFLNDGTQAKVGYYLDVQGGVTAATCRPDGGQDLELALEYTYAAPADAADLPEYLVGTERIVQAGEFQTNLLLYLPTGSQMADVLVDGQPGQMHAQVHEGLSVASLTWVFEPGQKRTISAKITSGPGQSGDVLLRATPTASGFANVSALSSCGSSG